MTEFDKNDYVNGGENPNVMPADAPTDEAFTSYWYIQNMLDKGTRATDIHATNWTAYQVFKKDDQYTATIWNPEDRTIQVEFTKDGTNIIGSAYVPARATISRA